MRVSDGETTPGVVGTSAIPQTPGPAPATPRLKRASEGEEEGPERKRLDASDSPRKNQEKREAEAKDPGTEKKQRIGEEEEMMEEASASMPTSTPGTRPRVSEQCQSHQAKQPDCIRLTMQVSSRLKPMEMKKLAKT